MTEVVASWPVSQGGKYSIDLTGMKLLLPRGVYKNAEMKSYVNSKQSKAGVSFALGDKLVNIQKTTDYIFENDCVLAGYNLIYSGDQSIGLVIEA